MLILLPVLYFVIVFIMRPTFGASRSVCILGLLHSCLRYFDWLGRDNGLKVTNEGSELLGKGVKSRIPFGCYDLMGSLIDLDLTGGNSGNFMDFL
jgi:hypothetical protein